MQNQKRLSLKRHHGLFARGYFKKKSSVARQPLHNSTGSKCDAFQEKPSFLKRFRKYPLQTINPKIKNEPYLQGFKPDTSEKN
tara:strand:- start:274 stop:522 length:249 start_codon:yes stop_codon:yes gene_type:complete